MAMFKDSYHKLNLNEAAFKSDSDDEDIDVSEIKKLTDWENEPKLDDLKADFEASKANNNLCVQRITEYMNLRNIEGKERPPEIKGRSRVQPKLVRRQAEWRYSALSEPFLASDKLFKVEPRTWEDTKAAISNELILNYQFSIKINKVKFIDEYIRTGVDEGTVIVRVGWDRKTHNEPKENPILNFSAIDVSDQELVDQLTQLINLKTENPNEFLNLPIEQQEAVNYFLETDIPVTAEIVGYETIEEEVVDENRPEVSFVNPANFYIDPSCEGIVDNAKFIVTSFQTCLADLAQNESYTNLEAINVDNAGQLNVPEHYTKTPTDFQFKDKPRKTLIAYEYWGYYDIHGTGKLTPIVATWVNDTLIRMEESPYPDGKPPFVIVNYMPRNREIFGEADAELLADNQRILGALYRGNIDLLGRSANSQQGIAKGFLDPANMRRFSRQEDYEFNPIMPTEVGIYQHKYPEIPQSSMAMMEVQNQEAEALTGVKSFSGGMSGNAYGDVAAGIRGMLDAASKREMNILRRYAQGIREIGIKISAMNSLFLSEEEAIRITNTEFARIRREDLKGHFDLIVDISTPEVDQAKAQELSFMVQTIGNTVDFGITKKILAEIARLRRMPELAHDIATYEPQPDPMAEQLKQLEIEKAQLENEEIRSRIALNQAKAQETQNKADTIDLDYVEKQDGTAHQREMEKQKAQGEANQDLAVTKGILDSAKNSYKDDPVLNDIASNERVNQAMGYNELTKLKNSSTSRPDPITNLGSKYYNPSLDPTMNPRLKL